MSRDETFQQLAGPMVVIGAIGSAEVAAHALAIWPSSSLLWYLNLQVFQPFRYGFEGLGIGSWPDMGGGLAQSVWLQIVLIGLVGLGLMARMRLPLAIASNLSLIYGVALLYCDALTNDSVQQSGVGLIWLQRPSCLLAAAILVIALLSSTISHRSYWREIFS